jgi:hypothetical protein
MVRRRQPPSQAWRAFLNNHVKTLVSVDFFTRVEAAALMMTLNVIRCGFSQGEGPACVISSTVAK